MLTEANVSQKLDLTNYFGKMSVGLLYKKIDKLQYLDIFNTLIIFILVHWQ